MGIYDRGYMKDPKARNLTAPSGQAKPKETTTLSWWQRLRFRLWLLLHPGKGR